MGKYIDDFDGYDSHDDMLDDEYWYTDFLLNNLMEEL